MDFVVVWKNGLSNLRKIARTKRSQREREDSRCQAGQDQREREDSKCQASRTQREGGASSGDQKRQLSPRDHQREPKAQDRVERAEGLVAEADAAGPVGKGAAASLATEV